MNPRSWPLRWELSRWQALGHRPRLWLRDDDARQPGAALDRLLALCAVHGVPCAIAAIPDGPLGTLARRLRAEAGVTALQHGADHRNRRAAGEPSGEFAPDNTAATIRPLLAAGTARFRDAFPAAPPAFVPPWNALHPALPALLREQGFTSLSAHGGPPAIEQGLRRLDVHLDLLRWKGGPRARPRAVLARQLRQALRARRRAGRFRQPIGVLTHHLVQDEESWTHLDWLLRLPGLQWLSFSRALESGFADAAPFAVMATGEIFPGSAHGTPS
ncbi:hypothetical protein MVG78_08585 [Roseomonas gilardii subsp. gilardii]|uniref:hypothetical protein n=1 Tax=Roseomonas gilardii TaxID=257708 RepID=UPI001FFA510E|nr:hypothetical protein [Roseomonas gilardii]UPG74161.1 hypothetical protein MVG78_08585 [Roseomonas gilardii subsp. gilardii]